jgi:hypothetical protein
VHYLFVSILTLDLQVVYIHSLHTIELKRYRGFHTLYAVPSDRCHRISYFCRIGMFGTVLLDNAVCNFGECRGPCVFTSAFSLLRISMTWLSRSSLSDLCYFSYFRQFLDLDLYCM